MHLTQIKVNLFKEWSISPWLMWLSAISFVLFQLFLQLSIGTLLPDLVKSLQLTPLTAGLMSSGFYLIYVFLQMPAGMLVDRIGSRWLLTGGACLCAFGCYLFAISHSFFPAFMARLLMGIGGSCAYVSAMSVVAQEFPFRRFAFIVGITETIGMISILLANVGLAQLLTIIDWRTVMMIASLVGCGVGGLCWCLVPAKHSQPKASPTQTSPSFYHDVFWLIRQPWLWLNGIYSGIIFSSVTVFAALWGLEYLKAYQQLGATVAAIEMGCLFLGIAMASPLAGLIYHRLKDCRSLLAFAAWSVTLLMLGLIYLTPKSVIVVGLVCFMIGVCSVTYVFNFSIVRDAVPKQIVITAIGFTNTLCMLITPLFQAGIGSALRYLGGSQVAALPSILAYQGALAFLPFFLFLAGIMAYFLPSYHAR